MASIYKDRNVHVYGKCDPSLEVSLTDYLSRGEYDNFIRLLYNCLLARFDNGNDYNWEDTNEGRNSGSGKGHLLIYNNLLELYNYMQKRDNFEKHQGPGASITNYKKEYHINWNLSDAHVITINNEKKNEKPTKPPIKIKLENEELHTRRIDRENEMKSSHDDGSHGYGSRGDGSRGDGRHGDGSRSYGRPSDDSRGDGSRSYGRHSDDSRGYGRHGDGSHSYGRHSDDSRGDGRHGDGSRSYGRHSDDSRGDDSRSYGRHGDDSRGDDSRSYGRHGDDSRGDGRHGDDIRGDGSHGNGSYGDGSRGDGSDDEKKYLKYKLKYLNLKKMMDGLKI